MTEPTIPATSHHWRPEEKDLLCVLSRFFKIPDTADSKTMLVPGADRILCRIFAKEDNGRNISPWLTHKGIYRTLYELARQQHTSWKKVFMETDFADVFNRWSHQRAELVATAAELGIQLRLRKREHFKAQTDFGNPKEISSRRKKSISRSVGLKNSVRKPSSPKDASKRHSSKIISSSDDSAPNAQSWDTYCYADRLRGRIAYRVYHPGSHSMNCHQGSWPSNFTGTAEPVPLRSSEKFVNDAITHLTPLPKPSNFLSLTPSLFCALRHAQSLGPQATILIVDLTLVAKDQPPARLTPAKAVIKKQLKGFQGVLRRPQNVSPDDKTGSEKQKSYSFHGNIELLVWGPIQAEAIIGAIDVADLQRFLREYPSIDEDLSITKIGTFGSAFQAGDFVQAQRIRATRKVGRSVGAFLAFLGLDRKQTQSAAGQIQRRWNIRRHVQNAYQKRRPSKRVGNVVYMHGVLDGYNAKKLSETRAGFELVLNQPSSPTSSSQDEMAASENESDDVVLVKSDEDADEADGPRLPISARVSIDLTDDSLDEDDSDWDTTTDEDVAQLSGHRSATLARSIETLNLSEYRLTES